MQPKTISELVKIKESQFTSGTGTTISKYVRYDLHENNNRIDAYLNSKHISGDVDSQGREKPFFNIVLAVRNIWYRATDIDRKNIRIRATKRGQTIQAYLLNILLQDWMKKSNFGAFLNEWGRSLCDYGSSIVKFVEKGGELIPSVTPWNRLIVDSIDVDNDTKIEKLYFTPSQLRKNKAYDQEFVKDLIIAKTARKNLGRGIRKDNKVDFIEVYEVHGELERAYLTDDWEKDGEEFVQQMHVVSFVDSKEKRGEFDQFTLYRGVEAKDPYFQTHLIKEDGRATGYGAVESLFEAQWMVNHSQKAIKDQLDVASKLIFQTADEGFIGRNILTNLENGDILTYKPNAPLTQVANSSHDTTSITSFQKQWELIGQQTTGISESMLGVTPPSGTAYRQTAMILQESHSLFELMTENKGLYLEELLREYVLPFLKRKLNHSKEISALLDSQGIKEIDQMYIPNEAKRRYNQKALSQLINGEIPEQFNPQMEEQAVKEELAPLGNQRFFKPSDIEDRTWKEVLDGLEEEVTVEITNENTDKQATLDSLNTIFQTIASNPGVLNDPNAKMIFGKILEETGRISPLELAQVQTQQPMALPEGMPSPVGGSNAGQLPIPQLNQ